MRLAILLLALAMAGCARPPPPTVAAVAPAPAIAAPAPKVVLVAGDGSLPVFDNATAAMAGLLTNRGVAPADIQRLSARTTVIVRQHLPTATLDHVEAAVGAMHPQPGQGCLVFATSHGGEQRGLYLSRRQQFLTPAELDAALVQGCGDAPTAVVVSGCYTGDFAAPPMARDNRVILTAARPDRASFGCGAGRRLTFYDQCLLAAFNTASEWRRINDQTQACVARLEAGSPYPASEPQASFGAAVPGLSLRAPVSPPARAPGATPLTDSP